MWAICASASRRDVMSSWVDTQPPFCSGRSATSRVRPSASSRMVSVGDFGTPTTVRSLTKRTELDSATTPVPMRCSRICLCDTPGRISSGGSR